jgi:hypothetical protein
MLENRIVFAIRPNTRIKRWSPMYSHQNSYVSKCWHLAKLRSRDNHIYFKIRSLRSILKVLFATKRIVCLRLQANSLRSPTHEILEWYRAELIVEFAQIATRSSALLKNQSERQILLARQLLYELVSCSCIKTINFEPLTRIWYEPYLTCHTESDSRILNSGWNCVQTFLS